MVVVKRFSASARPARASRTILFFIVTCVSAQTTQPSTYSFGVLPPPYQRTQVTGDLFGQTMASVGQLLAIGAPGANTNTGYVATYYCASAGQCAASAVLTDPNAAQYHLFGASIAISSTSPQWLVIGAPGTSGTYNDRAMVFRCTVGTAACSYTYQLLPTSQSNCYFGQAVAISGTMVIVGGPNCNGGNGIIFTYDCTNPLSCTTKNANVPSPAPNSGSDKFGSVIAMSGSLAVVGSYQHTASGFTGAGTAYVLSCDTSVSVLTCAVGMQLTAPSPVASENFGINVAISGTVVYVSSMKVSTGKQGAVYVFSCTTYSACTLQTTLQPSDESSLAQFGDGLAVSSNYLLVGAPSQSTPNAGNAGGAYLFDCTTPSSCFQAAEILHPSQTPLPSAELGYSVAFAYQAVVLGTFTANSNAGSAYIYSCTSGTAFGPACASCTTTCSAGCSAGLTGLCTSCSGAWLGNSCALCGTGYGANCTACSSCLHGTCTVGTSGSCHSCTAGWTGTNCDQCTAGYGVNCTVSSACLHGTVTVGTSGSCHSCTGGWTGSNCDQCTTGYGVNCTASAACLHGTVYLGLAGNCSSCTTGWSGTDCDQCTAGYGSGCIPSASCAHGAVFLGLTGNCTCTGGSGWTGANCNQCTAGFGSACTSCSACLHGTCTTGTSGSCNACTDGWLGTNCDQCTAGYGVNCTASATCLHGSVTVGTGGSCGPCTDGWTGTNCDMCTTGYGASCTTASACLHGTVYLGLAGNCSSCTTGWSGTNCDQCTAGYGSSCTPSTSCMHGTVFLGANGNCTCSGGWTGANCDQCTAGYGPSCTVSSACLHGTVTVGTSGSCSACTDGWTGANCDQCTTGYGTSCTSCSSCLHGTCTVGTSGSCGNCSTNWTGSNCDQCVEGFFSSDCISCARFCLNGNCENGVKGKCTCYPGYTGPSCNQCLPNYFGSTCIPCNCGNGTCSDGITGDGSCVCGTGYSGVNCQTSTAGDATGAGVGVIVGSVLGGLAALAIVAVLIWWFCVRRRRSSKSKILDTELAPVPARDSASSAALVSGAYSNQMMQSMAADQGGDVRTSSASMHKTATNDFRSKPFEEWTRDDVGVWLKSLNVGKAAMKAFAKNKVSGDVLEDYEDENRLVGIGIAVGADRIRISKGIQQLRAPRRRASTNSFTDGTVLIAFKDIAIGDVIASGNFGKVYRGTFKGAAVAIKQPAVVDDATREDFMEEAKLMKAIPAHPNVVSYFGVCATDSALYLLMELCDKGSLQSYIRANPSLPVSTIVTIGSQIAAGMSHLSAFIVHRDLATRNVLLVSTSGAVPVLARVADFGLSRPLNNDGYMRVTARHPIPVPWTATEVLNNAAHTPAADVWSFGVVLWEMFTGCPVEPPSPDRTSVPLLSQPARCPDAVFALMTRCWAVNPKDRPTFETIFNELSNSHQ